MNQFLKISTPAPHTLIGSVSLEKALINSNNSMNYMDELQITSSLLNDRLNVPNRNII